MLDLRLGPITTTSKQPRKSSTQKLFTVDEFYKCIREQSKINDLASYGYTPYINAYDITTECIRSTVYRLLGYPLPDIRREWPGLKLRGMLGSAVHSYIQRVYPFTETEVELFIPERRVSVRVDAIINDNVLVEIKSMPYDKFIQFTTANTPRPQDLRQVAFYIYLLENYLSPIKQHSDRRIPKQDSYNFTHVQFIYVAHDICSSETESLHEAVALTKKIRRQLRGKAVDFIHVITKERDILDFDYIVRKWDAILYFLERKTLPDLSHEFINKSQCYFCNYKNICE